MSVEPRVRERPVASAPAREGFSATLGRAARHAVDLDRYSAAVFGRKVTEERLGPRTVLYRGQGLRFRMLGGGYRMVARGAGITVSAVGRGTVVLDAEQRFVGDDTGLYSLDGTDCSVDPLSCTPLPIEPERYDLEPPAPEPKGSS